eukprot:TRINITY_DN3447_c0_g1_i4.p1 TRINITY_DN3447_c0_g1~~TRINITY_DN3447_c0_g1_i4.p1  ORF type:complete len:315 (+),score=93.83 TRINITY_DN3447_c0_g1_i4:128-1072(+)
MNAVGHRRMRESGEVLKAIVDNKQRNKLVAVLSKRAHPISQWGSDLSTYPKVVEARVASLQTGDVVLCSSRVSKDWVGNTIQVLCDSTWNHVGIVIRGWMTEELDEKLTGLANSESAPGTGFAKKLYKARSPEHFHVERAGEEGEPWLLESTGEGVHIYADLHHRLTAEPSYEEYATIAVRCLQDAPMNNEEECQKLEDYIARVRGTEFEAEAELYELFSMAAAGDESMHCGEVVTTCLQSVGLVAPDFPASVVPPCAFADAPFGCAMKLEKGAGYGPLEVIKAGEEFVERKGSSEGAPAAGESSGSPKKPKWN